MTERLPREEAAARLRDLADLLAGDEDIELERDGERVKIEMPDEVGLEVELEVEREKPGGEETLDPEDRRP